MRIRKAKESDIPQLEQLFLITRQQTFHWEAPSKFKLEDYRTSTEGETVFVAEDNHGKIIGFISVWEQDTPIFIHHLFVSSDHQKKGVGTLLINTLLTHLPRPYRLKCVAKNRGAIAFYLKHNWIEIDRGIGEDGEYLLLELPAVYRNNLKNWDFAKEAPQNSRSERVTIAERQGASENENFEVKPTKAKTNYSSCFGISQEEST